MKQLIPFIDFVSGPQDAVTEGYVYVRASRVPAAAKSLAGRKEAVAA